MRNESIKGICHFKRQWVTWSCLFLMMWSFPVLSFAGTGADESGVKVTTTGTAGLPVTQSATGDLIDRTPYGEINWTQGYIIAYGKGDIPKGLNEDICDSMAKRAALIDAHARALEMAQGINLDGDISVGKYVSKNSRLFYRLKGLVARVKPFEQYRGNDIYTIKIRVPFYGINGIQTVFLNSYVKQNNKSISPPPAKGRIVIDARGTGLKPAMFAKIEDQTGENVYTAQDVSRSVLQEKGLVQYVTATTITQGDIQAKALKADGRQNSNIVISPGDAGKMKQAGSVNVIVITDSPVGGPEGSLYFMFASSFKRKNAHNQ